ncbi:hypothetical protein DACRYDRAFT_94451 [Dacryopinax primogenitus]|uniref:Uncharacterized protein n=1 Tax=Dacryopinax primogenitus (strain DJM 731) TaxID=1858805 RepID=M5G3D7_DACPD|nr:uncharacterized protein DACRYDRAFT_94451 [Dacryopinax primogenitus]EJU02735.1 hypothetical protein DACRYDRAFT_94451 [Dacryopinax primogenitus]
MRSASPMPARTSNQLQGIETYHSRRNYETPLRKRAINWTMRPTTTIKVINCVLEPNRCLPGQSAVEPKLPCGLVNMLRTKNNGPHTNACETVRWRNEHAARLFTSKPTWLPQVRNIEARHTIILVWSISYWRSMDGQT